MLKLPNVTLLMVETQEHALADLAVHDSISRAEFEQVFVFTDDYKKFPRSSKTGRCTFYQVPNWSSKLEWSQGLWYYAAMQVRTSHQLHIQWDSWLWDPSMWNDEFLEYDYVGAPWWYTDGRNVGNGGFSLRSTRLHRFLSDNRDRIPCNTAADDDLLCRKYRPHLECDGFEWAPECVARDFAFEWRRPKPDSRHFGFHALYNFGEVLNEDEMLERTRLVLNSPYIRKRENIWSVFTDKYQDVLAKINAMNKESLDHGCITGRPRS